MNTPVQSATVSTRPGVPCGPTTTVPAPRIDRTAKVCATISTSPGSAQYRGTGHGIKSRHSPNQETNTSSSCDSVRTKHSEGTRHTRGVASFLDACDPPAVQWLHERGVPRSFPPGTALFIEGERSDRVLIVLHGRVKVATATPDGRETVLAFRGPGEVLGEMSAIDGLPRSASVIAVDPVQALALSSPDFLRFLESTPKATLWLLTHVIARLRENDRKRAEFGVTDTMGRVAARLAELASAHGIPAQGGVMIDLPITQEELASWVGSSREGVNKALNALKSLGWVRIERRSITVLDLEKVRARGVSSST